MKAWGICLGLLLVVSVLPAKAEVYKWVDDNGKVHFGDRAPENKPAENIEDSLKKTNLDEASKSLATSNPSGYTGGQKKTADEELLELRKREALEARIGKQCRDWLEEIKIIARGDLVAFHDENGNPIEVLEKDRNKKLEEWKEGYRNFGCEQLYPVE